MRHVSVTLDSATAAALARHARAEGKSRATMARDLVCEALARRGALARQRKLARDYAAGRDTAAALLADLKGAQSDLLDDADA